MNTQSEGRIITFYSYKGGTGRSMALANVAWILASAGYRVMALDWDLEAPGLHRYFHPFLLDPDLSASEGLIDIVTEFATGAMSKQVSTDPNWFIPFADVTRYAQSLRWPYFSKPGRLDYIPAGRQDTGYPVRVNSFHWKRFYEELGGGVFFEALKRSLRSEYDFTLIDSRTGVSDTSGICTVQMPDDLVVCFTMNSQSIQGAAAVARSAFEQRSRPSSSRPLSVWPLPCRIELAERNKLDAARERARAIFGPVMKQITVNEQDDYFASRQILYEPFYAYEEVLAAFVESESESRHSMMASMLGFAQRLVADSKLVIDPIPEKMRRETLEAFTYRPQKNVRELMTSFGQQYEQLRSEMPRSRERTRSMTLLINRLQRLMSTPPAAEEILAEFARATDGARISALALAILAPVPEHLPMVLDTIQNRRSAFEQFHGLSLAQGLLELIDLRDKAQLRSAIEEQLGKSITSDDPSRWELAQRIMKATELTSVTGDRFAGQPYQQRRAETNVTESKALEQPRTSSKAKVAESLRVPARQLQTAKKVATKKTSAEKAAAKKAAAKKAAAKKVASKK
jgi:MinD-like ATPase involved in chromosome partitioning or flagellar assembly